MRNGALIGLEVPGTGTAPQACGDGRFLHTRVLPRDRQRRATGVRKATPGTGYLYANDFTTSANSQHASTADDRDPHMEQRVRS